MKTIQIIGILIATNCLSLPSAWTSQGGKEGGGGSICKNGVVCDDDTISFGENISFSDFPKETRMNVIKIRSILLRLNIDVADFFDKEITGIGVPYIFVTPKEFEQVDCDKYLPNTSEENNQKTQYGCTTREKRTFLVSSIIDKYVKDDFERAREILHERLWTRREIIAPNGMALSETENRKIQDDIAVVVSVVGKLAKLKDAQINNNDRKPLTPAEMKEIEAIYPALARLKFQPLEVAGLPPLADAQKFGQKEPGLKNYTVLPGGGIIATRSRREQITIDPTAFIGVGSLILPGSEIRGDSVILNSVVMNSSINNSTVIFSKVLSTKLDGQILDGRRKKPQNQAP